MALALAAALCGQTMREGKACAEIVSKDSSAWVDGRGGTSGVKHFVFRVHVAEWVPNAQVTLDWGNADVLLENIYDAQPIEGYDGTGPVTVELGANPSEPNQFLMMGTGTNNFHPKITCEAIERARPPHQTLKIASSGVSFISSTSGRRGRWSRCNLLAGRTVESCG